MRRAWGNKPRIVLSAQYHEYAGNLYVWCDHLPPHLPPHLTARSRCPVRQLVIGPKGDLSVGHMGSSKVEWVTRDSELVALCNGLLADPHSIVDPLLDKLQEVYPPFGEIAAAYMEQR